MKAVFTLIAGTLLSTSVFADVVIVDGLVHKLNKSDFVQQGNTYVKTLEVIGDTGNTLVFDLDATVGGQGSQEVLTCDLDNPDTHHLCVRPRPDIACLPLDRDCDGQAPIEYSKDFRYMVEMKLSCSGTAIGTDLEHRNAYVNGKVENKYREVDLLISEQKVLGQCQQLRIEIDGLELDSIDSIDMDLLVGYAF